MGVSSPAALVEQREHPSHHGVGQEGRTCAEILRVTYVQNNFPERGVQMKRGSGI